MKTDKIREKLFNLGISYSDIKDAISWAKSILDTEQEIKEYLFTIENKLPIDIIDWEIKICPDNSGDPAVYVYPTVKTKIDIEKLDEADTIISNELHGKIDPEKFLYIRFKYKK